jgi:Tfp pilus assembly protein PilX
MKHISHAATNEEGSVLLLTLVLLILLTIAGLGILSTTNTDLQITQNDRCFKQNLTRAESAVMEAAQIMAYYEATTSKLMPTEAGVLAWIEASGFDPFGADQWVSDSTSPALQTAQLSKHFTDSLSAYSAIYEGIAPGSSLDLSSPTTMRQYEVTGRSEQCNGLLNVIAGYRIRF